MADEWRTRLMAKGLPSAVLIAAGFAAPVYGSLVALATHRQYADAPPSCYGIGFGCEFSPTDSGWLAAIVYLVLLLALGAVVAVLRLGRGRLELARSVVAIGGVSLIWAVALFATATS